MRKQKTFPIKFPTFYADSYLNNKHKKKTNALKSDFLSLKIEIGSNWRCKNDIPRFLWKLKL